MVFQDNDTKEEIAKERALSIFEDVLDALKANDSVYVTTSKYCIRFNNPAQFYLITDYLSVGATLQIALQILAMRRKSTSLASLWSLPDLNGTPYARFICALNLQSLKDMLAGLWIFSVAMNMSTHMATSYLNIYIRLHCNSNLLNFHLLAILMFFLHTGDQIFLQAANGLDLLAPGWKDVQVSISSTGERKGTVHIQGVVTRFEQAALPCLFRMWCGLHQLDIKLQRFFVSLMGEPFYSILNSHVVGCVSAQAAEPCQAYKR